MPSKFLLSARLDADRHERSLVGRIGFEHGDERYSGAQERSSNRHERVFVGRRQNNRVRALSQISRTTLSRRMNDLRCLDSAGKVGAHDDVVRDGVRRFGRLSVVAIACPRT